MNRNPLIVIPVIIAAALAFTLLSRQKTRQADMIREAETGVATWHQDEMKERIQAAEARFHESLEALKADDPRASFKAYYAGYGGLRHYVENYPDKEVKPGLTLKAWFEQATAPCLEATRAYFPSIIERLKSGDFRADVARQLKTNYGQVNLTDLVERFEKEWDGIAAARAAEADRWVHVWIGEEQHGYPELLRPLLKEKWNPDYGFELKYGGTLDQQERQATFKLVNIQVRQVNAQYEVRGGGSQNNSVSIPQIPEKVTIEINMEGTREVPTNWDKLPPYQTVVEVPESVLLKPEYRGGGAQAEAAVQEAQEGLIQAVREHLEKLPPFRLFPDVDPTTVQIREGDTLNATNALALRFLDAKRLDQQLKGLIATDDAVVKNQLPPLLVNLGQETFADYVTRTLPGMDRNPQGQALRALARRPDFGNYEPLTSFLKNYDGKYAPSLALDALRRHAAKPQVEPVLLAKATEPATPARGYYARRLIEDWSLEKVSEFAPKWIVDADFAFATEVFQAVRQRDRELASSYRLKFFDQVAPQVRSIMMADVQYDPKKDGPEMLQLLKKAAMVKEDKRLRDAAYKSLSRSAMNTNVWETLLEMEQEETDEGRLGSIQVDLMKHVGQLHPEKAEAFIQERLAGDHAEGRFQAVYFLLRLPQVDKAQALASIAEAVRAHPEDSMLTGAATENLSQHVRPDREDFTSAAEDLKTILAAGQKHKFPRTRDAAYRMMGSLGAAGLPGFDEMLQAASQTETQENLKRVIERELGKVK